MIRGILILVTNDEVLHTTEYNGGMDPDNKDSIGYEALNGLINCNSKEQLQEFIKEFNKEYFDYKEGNKLYDASNIENLFNFTNKNQLFLGTDYIYIKNISDTPLEITDSYGQGLRVNTNGYITLYYGEFNNDPNNNIEFTLSDYQREIIENNGWHITEIYDGQVELSKYSPAGEDFSFIVNIDNLIEEIKEYADSFDVDEHAITWYGGNGAPTSLRTLLDDAEEIQEMIEELAEKLNEKKDRNYL